MYQPTSISQVLDHEYRSAMRADRPLPSPGGTVPSLAAPAAPSMGGGTNQVEWACIADFLSHRSPGVGAIAKSRTALRELNAQDWQDFKAHWPMRVLDVAADFGCGTVLGVLFGLAVFIYGMELMP